MKTPAIVSAAVLALGVVLGASGCAQVRRSVVPTTRSPNTFALAVTVLGNGQPTAEQWATIQTTFRRELAAMGYTLVDDLSQADRIIRVEFTPSLTDPSTGQATILSIRPNPAYAYGGLRNSVYTSGFGYTYTPVFSSFYNSSFYNSIYGYNDPYYSTGSYIYTQPAGSGSAPPPTNPPTNPPVVHRPDHPRPDYNRPDHSRPDYHRPHVPADRPPGAPTQLPPISFAGGRPGHTPPADRGRYRPEPSQRGDSSGYARNNPTYSGSDRSYSPPPASSSSSSSYSSSSSSSGSSASYSSSSSSSSYSAPSYSPPAESSSSSMSGGGGGDNRVSTATAEK